jgi:hypothetical protein
LILLAMVVASGCAHSPEHGKEAAKPDTALVSAAATGVPALEVPEAYFDFGEVKEGTDYRHAFVIRNKGTGVLEIKKVQPGCGTSLASCDKAILPGAEGKVTIKLYPNAFQNGKKSRSLVLTNDPRVPRFTLEVQGKSQ